MSGHEAPDSRPQAAHGTAGGAGRVLARGLLCLLLILGGGEVLARLFIGGPSPQVYDPEIGYSYRPYSELFQAKEGYTRLRLNALGLNDGEVGAKNGRCRVLVIGDSYTAALQVPQDRNFTSVAEQLDQRLDVVNGGRDGLFLGDMHKVANRLSADVQPDLVVYVISQRAVEADIELPEFSVVVDRGSGEIQDAVMQVEQRELLKQTFAPLISRSALATRLSAQFKPVIVDALTQVNVWRSKLQPSVPGTPASAGGVVAMPAAEDVLTFVFRRFTAHAPAALLYINGLNYQPDHRASIAPTSSAAEAVARRAAGRAGVRLYDTGDYLVDSVARTGQPPFGFDNALRPGGHLNNTGHEAVGRALVDLVHDMGPTLATECSAK